MLILPMCFTAKIDFLKYASTMGVFTIVYIVGLIIYQVSNMFLLKIKQLDSEFLWLTDLYLYFPNSIYVSSKMRQIIEHIIVSLSTMINWF